MICRLVSSANCSKIGKVTLNALRTRQSLVKGERLVRYEVNAVMPDPRRIEGVGHGSWDRQWLQGSCSGNENASVVRRPITFPVEGCYPRGCAAPGSVPCQCNTRESPSKLKRASPQEKINVTSKSPVGDISVVTLIRTDTTLDHSQKAEKVWRHCLQTISLFGARCLAVTFTCHAANSTSTFARQRACRKSILRHDLVQGPTNSEPCWRTVRGHRCPKSTFIMMEAPQLSVTSQPDGCWTRSSLVQ